MTEHGMTDEQKVKAKWPDAKSYWTSRGWRVITLDNSESVKVVGFTVSAHVPESEAWADAACRLAEHSNG